jgi:hypothetical protein
MVHRLSLFATVVGLVAFAACTAPTEPTTALRPLLDGGACDTTWVHPDSVPDPNEYSDDEGCHVILPWVDLMRNAPTLASTGTARRK